MYLLDLTLDTPHDNVALDEALLEGAEAGEVPGEVLRLWESRQPFVVLGRSSIVATEARLDFCRAQNIPILRRCSGGAAIVTGPGCLMYAVVLDSELQPGLEMIDFAHRFVLEKVCQALQQLGCQARPNGTSDIVVGDRKVSGNSLRRKRRWLLYHGTLLYGMSASLIENCLGTPPRQPEYRNGRGHRDFVGAIDFSAAEIRSAMIASWQATEPLTDWPKSRMQELVATRYIRDDWNRGR